MPRAARAAVERLPRVPLQHSPSTGRTVPRAAAINSFLSFIGPSFSLTSVSLLSPNRRSGSVLHSPRMYSKMKQLDRCHLGAVGRVGRCKHAASTGTGINLAGGYVIVVARAGRELMGGTKCGRGDEASTFGFRNTLAIFDHGRSRDVLHHLAKHSKLCVPAERRRFTQRCNAERTLRPLSCFAVTEHASGHGINHFQNDELRILRTGRGQSHFERWHTLAPISLRELCWSRSLTTVP